MGETCKLLITNTRDRIFAGLLPHLSKHPCVNFCFHCVILKLGTRSLEEAQRGYHHSLQTWTGDCNEAGAGLFYCAYSERD